MYVIHIAELLHITLVLSGCSISVTRLAKGACCRRWNQTFSLLSKYVFYAKKKFAWFRPRIMTDVVFVIGPGLYMLLSLNYNTPIVAQHPLTSLQMQLLAENNKMWVMSFPSTIYFAILLCSKWRVSLFQKDTLSPPSSAVDLVNTEESSSGNMEIDNNVAASPKCGKTVKAGEATPEAIKSWKENGFSRFLLILHSESCENILF